VGACKDRKSRCGGDGSAWETLVELFTQGNTVDD